MIDCTTYHSLLPLHHTHHSLHDVTPPNNFFKKIFFLTSFKQWKQIIITRKILQMSPKDNKKKSCQWSDDTIKLLFLFLTGGSGDTNNK